MEIHNIFSELLIIRSLFMDFIFYFFRSNFLKGVSGSKLLIKPLCVSLFKLVKHLKSLFDSLRSA